MNETDSLENIGVGSWGDNIELDLARNREKECIFGSFESRYRPLAGLCE